MYETLSRNILVGNACFSLYLSFRQLRALQTPQNSTSKRYLTEEEYSKAASYNRSKCLFSVFGTVEGTIRGIIMLHHLSSIYGAYRKNIPFGGDVLFLLLISLFSSLLSIPYSLFSDFVIEAYYGFNKTTPFTFLKDFLLGTTIGVALNCLGSWIIIALTKSGLPNYWIYIWLVLAAFIPLFQIIHMNFIAPLFNTFKPLEDAELNEKVKEVADRIGFPVGKILVMDGSKRSGHGNAYFTGLGRTKNIVFFDTLLSSLNHEQVMGVLTHELGHWALWHIPILMAVPIVFCFFYMYAFHAVITRLGDMPVSLKILCFLYLSSILNVPLAFLQNLLMRALERQADRFAVGLGYGEALSSGLIALTKDNKASPINDRLYSYMKHTHPPLEERLECIQRAIQAGSKKTE